MRWRSVRLRPLSTRYDWWLIDFQKSQISKFHIFRFCLFWATKTIEQTDRDPRIGSIHGVEEDVEEKTGWHEVDRSFFWFERRNEIETGWHNCDSLHRDFAPISHPKHKIYPLHYEERLKKAFSVNEQILKARQARKTKPVSVKLQVFIEQNRSISRLWNGNMRTGGSRLKCSITKHGNSRFHGFVRTVPLNILDVIWPVLRVTYDWFDALHQANYSLSNLPAYERLYTVSGFIDCPKQIYLVDFDELSSEGHGHSGVFGLFLFGHVWGRDLGRNSDQTRVKYFFVKSRMSTWATSKICSDQIFHQDPKGRHVASFCGVWW